MAQAEGRSCPDCRAAGRWGSRHGRNDRRAARRGRGGGCRARPSRRARRRLAGAPDAEVILETLADVIRTPRQLAGRPAISALRERLAAERDRARQPSRRAAQARALSLTDLYLPRAHVSEWELGRDP